MPKTKNPSRTEIHEADEANLDDLVAASDTGGRKPTGFARPLILWTAVAWSLFQLWIASPLPYLFGDVLPVPNNTDTRSAHLAFSFFLAFLAFPASSAANTDR